MKTKKQKLLEKLDRLYQDYHRAKHPKQICELCGGPYEVAHHILPKSVCSGLRYNDKNLIFLCYKCHFKIHKTKAIPFLNISIGIIRGKKWYNYIVKHMKSKVYGIKYLESEITKYKKKIWNIQQER